MGGCIISKPYKMCDYKVAYGEMFQEYIKDYDFGDTVMQT